MFNRDACASGENGHEMPSEEAGVVQRHANEQYRQADSDDLLLTDETLETTLACFCSGE